MGRGLLLWLLGVPIPVIILLWLFLGRTRFMSCVRILGPRHDRTGLIF